jgi:predicted outer membrane repeat protein
MRTVLSLAAGCCLLLSIAVAPVAAGPATLVDCRSGGDLQATIDGANPGATLTIAGTCVGNFVVDKDLTIIGRTRNATLNGAGSGTTLQIPSLTVTVSIADLRITGGATGLGVGESATVTVARTWIGGNPGDGVVTSPRNVLTLQDSIVQGNDGIGVNVIGPSSAVVMRSSTVRENGGDGITVSMQGVVSLDQSIVMNNGARGISVWNGSVTVDQSKVSGNADGGIHASDLAYLFVHGSTITGNTAETLGGGLLVERGIQASGGLVLQDTTIANNTAAVSGGGLYITTGDVAVNRGTLTNVRFVRNSAGTSGGGMGLVGTGVLTQTEVTFHRNVPDDCLGC